MHCTELGKNENLLFYFFLFFYSFNLLYLDDFWIYLLRVVLDFLFHTEWWFLSFYLFYAFLFLSLLVFDNFFLRCEHFMISLVMVLLMKGAWFALTYLCFKDTCFLRVTSTIFLNFLKEQFSQLELNWKNIFRRSLIKASFEDFLLLQNCIICGFCLLSKTFNTVKHILWKSDNPVSITC